MSQYEIPHEPNDEVLCFTDVHMSLNPLRQSNDTPQATDTERKHSKCNPHARCEGKSLEAFANNLMLSVWASLDSTKTSLLIARSYCATLYGSRPQRDRIPEEIRPPVCSK